MTENDEKQTTKVSYIADQITKLERSGYMDKATQSNFWMLADMLKEIRKYCHDAALDKQRPDADKG